MVNPVELLDMASFHYDYRGISMNKYRICCLILCVFLFASSSYGKSDSASTKRLIIGTKQTPPFSMQAEDGTWNGISIDLWRQVAAELNYTFVFEEHDLQSMLQGLETKALDAAVAALTVTSEREKKVDFTHPFYATGLGIATVANKKNTVAGVFKSLFSSAFLKATLGLILLILAFGILVWWFEKKKNAQQFGGGVGKGIASGFWWSAVTMTTVGYGDKAPTTLIGRIIAVIWMFAAVITISTFTAAISSSLTVQKLGSLIKGPDDLPRVRVGTIGDTTSADYLQKRRIAFQSYQTAPDGLKAIQTDDIDAFVYDSPLLRYLVNTQYNGVLQVLPGTFLPQDYAIGLPPNSPLREPINRALLRKISEPAWQDTLYRYLGQR